jgi:hypothetical protein
MDTRSLANYLLSEGMESLEENVVIDFIANAGMALTLGAIAWNRLKNADEKTVGEMIIDRIAELKKDKNLEGKSPFERVQYKLSRAVEKSGDFMYNVFEDLTAKKLTPEAVAEKVNKKIKFDEEEQKSLHDYLVSVSKKLNNMKRLTNY